MENTGTLRGQVEKLCGEWIVVHDEYNDTTIAKCSKCDEVDVIEFFIEAKDLTPFCPFCGSPMTDDAVDMLMERLEAIFNEHDFAAIEDILGDEYDLERLKELVDADKNEKCVIAPAAIGDTVYHITTCNNFWRGADGEICAYDGSIGDATGYYCPCELYESCPFDLEEGGSFDYAKHETTPQVFEDVVVRIVIDDMQEYLTLGYSGIVYFSDFGKTVFLNREEAEEALKGAK